MPSTELSTNASAAPPTIMPLHTASAAYQDVLVCMFTMTRMSTTVPFTTIIPSSILTTIKLASISSTAST